MNYAFDGALREVYVYKVTFNWLDNIYVYFKLSQAKCKLSKCKFLHRSNNVDSVIEYHTILVYIV